MNIRDLVKVRCPGNFANSALNGSVGRVLNLHKKQGEKIVTVKLLFGPESGRQW